MIENKVEEFSSRKRSFLMIEVDRGNYTVVFDNGICFKVDKRPDGNDEPGRRSNAHVRGERSAIGSRLTGLNWQRRLSDFET